MLKREPNSGDLGIKYDRQDFQPKGYMQAVYENKELGAFFSYFNLGESFDNELTEDGLRIELRHLGDWKEADNMRERREHVFVRNGSSGEYRYIGVSEQQIRSNDKRYVQYVMNLGILPREILKTLVPSKK